jgi:hypothetical protein
VGEHVRDDFVCDDWTVPEPMRDKEAIRQYFNAWMTAFPDMTAKQANRVVGDDAVAAEFEFTGTNTGTMKMGGMQMPPTNKTVVGRGRTSGPSSPPRTGGSSE